MRQVVLFASFTGRKCNGSEYFHNNAPAAFSVYFFESSKRLTDTLLSLLDNALKTLPFMDTQC